MRLIRKNLPPNSFQEYVRQPNASYEDMDANIKADLKRSLLEEQDNLCAYCERNITFDNMKIEHHCEQSICNGENESIDKRLEYTNLFAVCSGVIGKNRCCDTRKSDFTPSNGLPIEINPTARPHITTLQYTSSGLIKSNNPRFERELNEILNLNMEFLKGSRKKEWQKIFVLSRNTRGNQRKAKIQRLLDREIENNSPFKGMYEYMLSKYS